MLMYHRYKAFRDRRVETTALALSRGVNSEFQVLQLSIEACRHVDSPYLGAGGGAAERP